VKILIKGLLGIGKTCLAERLVPIIGSAWFNADKNQIKAPNIVTRFVTVC
jgi:hypothetical protein